jgi:hypothetical protein
MTIRVNLYTGADTIIQGVTRVEVDMSQLFVYGLNDTLIAAFAENSWMYFLTIV